MTASRSNPADAAVGDLLRGDRLISGKTVVGPLEPKARRLLEAIWDSRKDLSDRKSVDQATTARSLYLARSEENYGDSQNEPNASVSESVQTTAPQPSSVRRWRLHGLRSQSIRGIAPSGVPTSFPFDGVPLLVYGPNGSGKSSLLGAVGWVLADRVITDGDEESDSFALYTPPNAAGRATKLRDWPTIHTLPMPDSVPESVPDCWAELHLKTEDGTQELYLKRSLALGLEHSEDGVLWKPCPELSEHGISPLDIQLSVSAATVFGRRTLESSPNTRHLLSMMLGYDPLEELGSLITTLASNLTKVAKAERAALTARQQDLRLKMSSFPIKLREGLDLRQRLIVLVNQELLDVAQIRELRELAASEVVNAEAAIASLLEMDAGTQGVPVGLADSLSAAVRVLETSPDKLFPKLNALATFQNSTENGLSGGGIDRYIEALVEFEQKTMTRVVDRLIWWKREASAGSKVTLLTQAAMHFESADEACPVCEQGIAGTEIASQLFGLKDVSADLRSNIREFFRNLVDEVQQVIPAQLLGLSDTHPARCLREDWKALRSQLGIALVAVLERFDPQVEIIAEALPPIEFSSIELIPNDADAAFAEAATPWLAMHRRARRGIAVALWATQHLPGLISQVSTLVTSRDCASYSLLSILGRGKQAAADVEPVVAVREGLEQAAVETASMKTDATNLAVFEEMQTALESIKPLGKYATAEVERIFTDIRQNTIENIRKLYPHGNPDLSPSRLHLNKGRDKTVEAYLSAGTFEVPGQHVANAGLLRAIALAFYFALLERHPGGLGFVVMDDPILSLDDDHREAWAANILKPALAKSQIIVATHQRQFLNNCRTDFFPGRAVELNPRTRSKQITYRPGDRLDRAEELLITAMMSVPNELRKYREDVIITLDAYSPTPFFDVRNLQQSLDKYLALTSPHQLASPAQEKIGKWLKDPRIVLVLDPGSHSLTEASVTESMIKDCLSTLRELDNVFRKELERLEAERLRILRSRSLPLSASPAMSNKVAALLVTPVEQLRIGEDATAWTAPIRLQLIGTAAAQTHGCVVSIAEEPWESEFPAGRAVLVAGDTLCPIARPGQWVLLSEEVVEGELVAGKDRLGNRYLRRVWSHGDSWILEAVNPLAGVSPAIVRKSDCILRKVIGVSYRPRKAVNRGAGRLINEWTPREDFGASHFTGLYGISIEGTSLEPIAQNAQVVLVAQKIDGRSGTITRGSLAVVETDDDRVGNVIKRIFPDHETWLLTSPNPIDPRDPITIARGDIRAIWPVTGVVFDVAAIEQFDVEAIDVE